MIEKKFQRVFGTLAGFARGGFWAGNRFSPEARPSAHQENHIFLDIQKKF